MPATMDVPTIKAIAPWFGGNRLLAPAVGEELAGASWIGIPFAGGMAELLHVQASTIVVNDKHWHVMNLANVLRHPELGPKLYRKLKREAFHEVTLTASQVTAERSFIYRTSDSLLDFEAAHAYFITQWMGRSGKAGTDSEFSGALPVRWSASGGDSNTRYRSAVRSLIAWRRILARCNFTVLDAFDFVEKCKDQPGSAIYCDPPFPEAGGEYRHKFSDDDHACLAERLSEFSAARVVCRFYDHPLIQKLYPSSRWTWRRLKGRKQSNAEAPEVLLINGPSQARPSE